MNERYFEDFKCGDIFQSDTVRVTADAIVDFARQFDPQIFHLDLKVAERRRVKGLIASGWHTAALSMRLFVEAMNVPGGIIGLGVDELRWPHPVRPGDELRLEIKIIETRLSKSRPGTGIIRIQNTTRNQRNEVVQTFAASAMIPTRAKDLD
jgi:acyl dehydratase